MAVGALEVTVNESPFGSMMTNLNSEKLPRHNSKLLLSMAMADPCTPLESIPGGSLLQLVNTTICTSRTVVAMTTPFLISSIFTANIPTWPIPLVGIKLTCPVVESKLNVVPGSVDMGEVVLKPPVNPMGVPGGPGASAGGTKEKTKVSPSGSKAPWL